VRDVAEMTWSEVDLEPGLGGHSGARRKGSAHEIPLPVRGNEIFRFPETRGKTGHLSFDNERRATQFSGFSQ